VALFPSGGFHAPLRRSIRAIVALRAGDFQKGRRVAPAWQWEGAKKFSGLIEQPRPRIRYFLEVVASVCSN
jgi:hypothetical protein